MARVGAPPLRRLAAMAAGVILISFAGLVACSPSARIGLYSTALRDDRPLAPFAITPGLFYVGSSDIAVYALPTSEGIILIDGGYAATGRRVQDNLRALGLDPADIRILLNTHGHFDHAAGLAGLKAVSGAALYSSPEEAPLLTAGGRGDFALGDWMTYAPVKVDRILEDGRPVTLGERSLTPRFTPGHTPGCTSWSFRIEVDGEPADALILCSTTVLPIYRTDDPQYPDMGADLEATFAALREIPCELFLANHGKFFDLADKRRALIAGDRPNPFLDEAGCRAFLEDEESRFRRRFGRAAD